MLKQRLQAKLNQQHAKQHYRYLDTRTGPQQAECTLADGKTVINFCSNDYLGLANHPNVLASWREACEQYGIGSGASRLVSGHAQPHESLQQALAEFTGFERTLVFGTGYMANLAVLGTLVQRDDLLLQDKFNHASLLDAAVLSRARMLRFHHNDEVQAAALLEEHPVSETQLQWLVTEGVFSMDGHISPLPALVKLSEPRHRAIVVDDAHGFGVLGSHGRGSLEHHGIEPQQVDVMIATFGKSLGTFGAFVAGNATVIDALTQFARPFIYTTAPPPALSAATHAALAILQAEPQRRTHVHELIAYFRTQLQDTDLELTASGTPIQAVILGDSDSALRASEHLRAQGIFVKAIRPPTVPKGTARLRITLTAGHTKAHVDRLITALKEIT